MGYKYVLLENLGLEAFVSYKNLDIKYSDSYNILRTCKLILKQI